MYICIVQTDHICYISVLLLMLFTLFSCSKLVTVSFMHTHTQTHTDTHTHTHTHTHIYIYIYIYINESIYILHIHVNNVDYFIIIVFLWELFTSIEVSNIKVAHSISRSSSINVILHVTYWYKCLTSINKMSTIRLLCVRVCLWTWLWAFRDARVYPRARACVCVFACVYSSVIIILYFIHGAKLLSFWMSLSPIIPKGCWCVMWM